MTKQEKKERLRTARRLRVAEVLERYRWRARLGEQGYSAEQLSEVTRVLNLITACRTGKLGSHLFTCRGCEHKVMGLNKCTNRHCTSCGSGRREQWCEEINEWILNCDYWHVVFTLPHELNPLMLANPKHLYKMLFRCVAHTLRQTFRRQLGCQPGMIMTLHTWGQQMNSHVHVHVILTAGGLSTDGKSWIPLPPDHPGMSKPVLAAAFKRTYLRRLRYWFRSDKLVWSHLESSAASESSAEILVDSGDVDPTEAEAKNTEAERPQRRELTDREQQLLKSIEAKGWIVNCQPPQLEHEGAEGIVNYLAGYVSGIAIGNCRLLDDDGQYVTFRYKDYTTGDVKTIRIPGPEFVRRFCLHILPRGLQRVRYSGLFTTARRQARMDHCRKLIGGGDRRVNSQEGLTKSKLQAADADLLQEEADEAAATKCICRKCQGELAVVGRLEGTPTLKVMALANSILAVLPLLADWVSRELLSQLLSGAIDRSSLPNTIGRVLDNQELGPLEMTALSILLQGSVDQESSIFGGQHTTGIPPPDASSEVRTA